MLGSLILYLKEENDVPTFWLQPYDAGALQLEILLACA